jgi:DNA-binding response OmpR family regulator
VEETVPPVRLLDLRADDSLTKPFGTAELLAQVRVALRHAGRALTHRQLLEQVWGTNYVRQTHYLRVYMAQLRHKLELDPTRPRVLLTEPGVGYRVRERESS